MIKKIGISIGIILGILYAIGNAAIILNFPDIHIQNLQNKFSSVHFTAPGNNFGGAIFWLASKSLSTPETISLPGGTKKICTKQIRGLYYNSQRGERIWPLDHNTLNLLQQQHPSYQGLQINGGLYTNCNDSTYNIFGYITYNQNGTISHIIAGTKLKYTTNKYDASDFANNFQYFDNKVPIGYIRDSIGGIGYIGGLLTGHEQLIDFLNNGGTISSGFIYSGNTIISHTGSRTTTIESGNNAMETARNLIVQGSIGLSKSIDNQERISLLGNFENKTIIYNGTDINSSTLINTAKQKAKKLCQGKIINPISQEENILCYENTEITIDLNQPETYRNKTFIIKNGNIRLQGGMNQNTPPLDLFIDKGLLILPTTISEQQFNENGFPTNISGINAGLYLKGNFIINGLIKADSHQGFNHKLHLQGKITMLNTPIQPSLGKISQIEKLLGLEYINFINLQNIFVRQCGFGGTGSDNTLCNTGNTITTTPFIILNGNYPSNILQ